VTGNRADNRTCAGANGTPAQCALLGIRHAGASTQRQADYQNKYQ
jgi:hypothetical protein